MAVAFVVDRPNPVAPFRPHYLFGRGQEVGLTMRSTVAAQAPPHSLLALSAERVEDTINTAAFWLNADLPPLEETVLCVGAGVKVTGFSLTLFTFVASGGQALNLGRLNHYVADAAVAAAAWLA